MPWCVDIVPCLKLRSKFWVHWSFQPCAITNLAIMPSCRSNFCKPLQFVIISFLFFGNVTVFTVSFNFSHLLLIRLISLLFNNVREPKVNLSRPLNCTCLLRHLAAVSTLKCLVIVCNSLVHVLCCIFMWYIICNNYFYLIIHLFMYIYLFQTIF